jgi:membrane protease subunit HflK
LKFLRRSGYLVVLLGLAAAYGLFGVFQIGPSEEGVVLRLGGYVRTVTEGPHWRALGIETVERRLVAVEREEFGFRTIAVGPPAQYEDVPEERLMLTGDANLVDVEFVVRYQISDLAAWQFNVADGRGVIRDAAQAAIREVVATHPIDEVLTGGRTAIALATRDLLQKVLDAYGAGVRVLAVQLQEVEPPDPVKDSFRDVASAQQDRERTILEAQGYHDQIVPRARGEKEALINSAQAYSERRVLAAKGESDRFLALLAEYRKAPEVTRERLYIETLETILPGMDKVIIEGGTGDNLLPYLPLGRKGRSQ